jgi:hypothetical protein
MAERLLFEAQHREGPQHEPRHEASAQQSHCSGNLFASSVLRSRFFAVPLFSRQVIGSLLLVGTLPNLESFISTFISLAYSSPQQNRWD